MFWQVTSTFIYGMCHWSTASRENWWLREGRFSPRKDLLEKGHVSRLNCPRRAHRSTSPTIFSLLQVILIRKKPPSYMNYPLWIRNFPLQQSSPWSFTMAQGWSCDEAGYLWEDLVTPSGDEDRLELNFCNNSWPPWCRGRWIPDGCWWNVRLIFHPWTAFPCTSLCRSWTMMIHVHFCSSSWQDFDDSFFLFLFDRGHCLRNSMHFCLMIALINLFDSVIMFLTLFCLLRNICSWYRLSHMRLVVCSSDQPNDLSCILWLLASRFCGFSWFLHMIQITRCVCTTTMYYTPDSWDFG